MSDTLALLHVSAPRRAGDGDVIRIRLDPRVENYRMVALAVERVLRDKSTFSTLLHTSGDDVWAATVVSGVRLRDLHHRIAGKLNIDAELPFNVRAIPEGVVSAFDGDDDADAEENSGAAERRKVATALKSIERARAELSAAEETLRRR